MRNRLKKRPWMWLFVFVVAISCCAQRPTTPFVHMDKNEPDWEFSIGRGQSDLMRDAIYLHMDRGPIIKIKQFEKYLYGQNTLRFTVYPHSRIKLRNGLVQKSFFVRNDELGKWVAVPLNSIVTEKRADVLHFNVYFHGTDMDQILRKKDSGMSIHTVDGPNVKNPVDSFFKDLKYYIKISPEGKTYENYIWIKDPDPKSRYKYALLFVAGDYVIPEEKPVHASPTVTRSAGKSAAAEDNRFEITVMSKDYSIAAISESNSYLFRNIRDKSGNLIRVEKTFFSTENLLPGISDYNATTKIMTRTLTFKIKPHDDDTACIAFLLRDNQKEKQGWISLLIPIRKDDAIIDLDKIIMLKKNGMSENCPENDRLIKEGLLLPLK